MNEASHFSTEAHKDGIAPATDSFIVVATSVPKNFSLAAKHSEKSLIETELNPFEQRQDSADVSIITPKEGEASHHG